MEVKTYVSYRVFPFMGKWHCEFICDRIPDADYRGKCVYKTEKLADEAGRRYIKKMLSYGFHVKE